MGWASLFFSSRVLGLFFVRQWTVCTCTTQCCHLICKFKATPPVASWTLAKHSFPAKVIRLLLFTCHFASMIYARGSSFPPGEIASLSHSIKKPVVLPGVHQLPATSLFFIAAAVEQQTIATAEIGRIILIYSPRIELTASLVSMDSKHLFFSRCALTVTKKPTKLFKSFPNI